MNYCQVYPLIVAMFWIVVLFFASTFTGAVNYLNIDLEGNEYIKQTLSIRLITWFTCRKELDGI